MRVARGAWATTLLAVLAAPAVRAQLPFDPGERVSFELTYFGMTAGDITLQVGEGSLDGTRVWPLQAVLRTRGLVNAFFSLDNLFVSFFDPARARSLGSDNIANDNGDRHVDRIRLRGPQAHIRVERNGRVHETTRDIDPASHDVLSAVYHLRTQTLRPGAVVHVPIFTGWSNWVMDANVDGRERVRTDAGTFDTLHLRCRTHFDGKYKAEREMEIWMTDDDRHLPVKIEAPFYIATLRMKLTNYSPGFVAQRRLGTSPQ